jgi:hypothetical protein
VPGVVAGSSGHSVGFQRSVEIVARAVFALAGGDQPGELIFGPDRAAPPLDFDLEQDLEVNGADAFVAGVVVRELVASLVEQRVVDAVERLAGAGDGQFQVLAPDAQRGAGGSIQSSSSIPRVPRSVRGTGR